MHTDSRTLPPARVRRVVYLDQFVLSNMAKVLDPVWSRERPRQAAIWSRMFDALDRARALHLVVCPESRVQERESLVHPHFKVLERLYEHFGDGTRFLFPTEIHGVQLRVALDAVLAGRVSDFTTIPREDLISGDLATWMERLGIKVNMGRHLDEEKLRQGRDRSGDFLAKLFEQWRQEKPSFDEVYRSERVGLAQAMIELLHRHLELFAAVSLGRAPVTEDVWNYRLEVSVALDLVRTFQETGIGFPEAIEAMTKFVFSEEALTAPMNEIGALMFAGLAHRAATGQKRPPSRGMANDITAVSAFLPYCDAMFLDNECATLLTQGPVGPRLENPPRIFSTRTAEEFIDYLEDLEAETGPDWVEQVVTIYGESWLEPFRSILAYTRERSNATAGEEGSG